MRNPDTEILYINCTFEEKSVMKFKIIIFIILLILLVVFALQNAEIVQIKLWFWSFETPGVLLILVSVSAGVIIGMIFSHLGSKKSKKEPEKEADAEEPAGNNFFE
jgi:putative membrane protein